MLKYGLIALAAITVVGTIFWYGSHYQKLKDENNAKDQVIIQSESTHKVDKMDDATKCSRALGGKLSESGECE